MQTIRLTIVITALFGAAPTFGQSEPADAGIDFDLPSGELGGIAGDNAFNLEDVDFVGNPGKSLSEKWPEDLVVAPIPGYSPQLGWNLVLAGGYFLGGKQEETGTPPSVIGGFGMFAENGSYAYGAGANLHLLEDKLRITAGAGYGDIRYRFYGIGNASNDLGFSFDILQEMPLYFATASWNVWSKLYVGIGYLGGEVESRLRIIPPELPFLDPALKVDIGAINIPIQYDSRDHEQFPRNGWLINGRTKLHRKSAGSSFDAETFKLAINHYRPVRDQDVLAFRAMFRGTNGDAPFFLLSTFGGSTDLRGYPSGRYRDRMMYALQSEYRWHFNNSWIFTGFAGFGEVAESFGDMGENFLPAAGVGARFVISQKHRIGLSMDIAQGKDGTEFYFGVGEAF